jgi:hypothetical protein
MKKTNQAGGYENLEKLKTNLKEQETKLDLLFNTMREKRLAADEKFAETKPSTNITIIYNIFSSLLLIISYILFGIASVIFINTCINFNKASIIETEPLLINQPIFEYLKPNNNLSIDKFLLYFHNGINNPFTIVINSITFISLIIVSIIIYYLISVNKFDILKKELYGTNEKKRDLFIKILIFILTIIIYQSAFNNIQKQFDTRFETGSSPINIGLYNYDFEKDIGIRDEKDGKDGKFTNLFKEVKNIIIHWINNNEHKDIKMENFDNQIKSQLTEGNNIKLYDDLIKKRGNNIFYNILIIYYNEYYVEKKIKVNKEEQEIDEKKKIKFINFIDEYFNILINIKSTDTNNYARYYLLGLIKYKLGDTNSEIYILRNFKNLLDTELTAIKEDIIVYYKTVIAFYVIFLFIIFILYFPFIFNTVSELLFMYKINYYGVFTSIIIIIVCVYVGIFKPNI